MLDCEFRSFQECRRDFGPQCLALLMALLGRELSRAEGLLEGMVRAGLGLDAIAAYLGCARTQVLDEITGRGIVLDRQSIDRPFRPRKNAWSTLDHMLFIAGWASGARVPAIAEVIGRSPSSLYGKRRRLGLPTRRSGRADASANPTQTAITVAISAIAAAQTTAASEAIPQAASAPPPSERPIQPALPPVASDAPAQVASPPAAVSEALPQACPALEPTQKKKRAPRQAKPSTLSPATQPELYAAVKDFMANRLPAGVDIVRNYATKNHVITGVALLGGMKRTAIVEAAGFTQAGVNGHIERLHLSSKGARKETFDAQRFEAALRSIIPECDSETKRLIFRSTGDHRLCVVRKRDARRRELAEQRRLEKRAAQRREREERARVANIVVRRGVSLPRLRCLEGPEIRL